MSTWPYCNRLFWLCCNCRTQTGQMPGQAQEERRGIGVVQPQSGTDFPLVYPSADIRDLLADLYLEYVDPADYDDSVAPFPFPFRIKWLYGCGLRQVNVPRNLGGRHSAAICIVAADGRVVFDSRNAPNYFARNWSNRLRIYAWTFPPPHTPSIVCRLVTHHVIAEDFPIWIEPQSAEIDIRCIRRIPKRLVSLWPYSEDIQIVAGYNVEITAANVQNPATFPGITSAITEERRHGHQIVINVKPGSGQGRYPIMVPKAPPLVRKINQVGPTPDGLFQLSATDCFWSQPPPAYVARGNSAVAYATSRRWPESIAEKLTYDPGINLQLGQDCKPCCGCDKFVATANYVHTVTSALRELGARAERLRDDYHKVREAWAATVSCHKFRILRLFLYSQACRLVDVVAQVVNPYDHPLDNTVIQFDCSPYFLPSKLPQPVSGYTQMLVFRWYNGVQVSQIIRADLAGKWPQYFAHWDNVPAHKSVWIRFRLRLSKCSEDDETITLPTVQRITVEAKLKRGEHDVLDPERHVSIVAKDTVVIDCRQYSWMHQELSQCVPPVWLKEEDDNK